LAGDAREFADHRLSQRGVAIVELDRVGPAGEIRIATVSEQARAVRCGHAEVIPRRAGQVDLAAAGEVIGMLPDPRMIGRHVVRDEIEHELEAALAKTFA
jgi:hypothetical protein